MCEVPLYPLSSKFRKNKTVKARFWPWLEPFFMPRSLTYLSCSFFARQRAGGKDRRIERDFFIDNLLVRINFYHRDD